MTGEIFFFNLNSKQQYFLDDIKFFVYLVKRSKFVWRWKKHTELKYSAIFIENSRNKYNFEKYLELLLGLNNWT